MEVGSFWRRHDATRGAAGGGLPFEGTRPLRGPKMNKTKRHCWTESTADLAPTAFLVTLGGVPPDLYFRLHLGFARLASSSRYVDSSSSCLHVRQTRNERQRLQNPGPDGASALYAIVGVSAAPCSHSSVLVEAWTPARRFQFPPDSDVNFRIRACRGGECLAQKETPTDALVRY